MAQSGTCFSILLIVAAITAEGLRTRLPHDEKTEKPDFILVIKMPDSGSRLLDEVFDRQPEVSRWVHEFQHVVRNASCIPHQLRRLPEEHGIVGGSIDANTVCFIPFMHDILSKVPPNTLLVTLLRDPFAKHINQYRVEAVGCRKGAEHNRLNDENCAKKMLTEAVKIDTKKLRQKVIWDQKQNDYLVDLAKEAVRRRPHDLSYAEITFEELMECQGVPASLAKFLTETGKPHSSRCMEGSHPSRPRALLELITNIDEVKEQFADTQWLPNFDAGQIKRRREMKVEQLEALYQSHRFLEELEDQDQEEEMRDSPRRRTQATQVDDANSFEMLDFSSIPEKQLVPISDPEQCPIFRDKKEKRCGSIQCGCNIISELGAPP